MRRKQTQRAVDVGHTLQWRKRKRLRADLVKAAPTEAVDVKRGISGVAQERPPDRLDIAIPLAAVREHNSRKWPCTLRKEKLAGKRHRGSNQCERLAGDAPLQTAGTLKGQHAGVIGPTGTRPERDTCQPQGDR